MLKKQTRKITGHIFILLVFMSITTPAAANTTAAIEIDKNTCQKVQRHLAREDVTYKPGVDVRGRKVAPADVDQQKLQLNDTIVLDVSVPLQDLFAEDNPPNRALQNAEVEVGKLEYQISSGKLLFNGQELSKPALLEVGGKCYEVFEEAQ